MSQRETYLPSTSIGTSVGEKPQRPAETSIIGCLNRLFDPDGMYDSEQEVLASAFRCGLLDPISLEFDSDTVELWEYNSGRSYKFKALPVIVALATRELVEEKRKSIQAENEKKLEEIAGRGAIKMPCGHQTTNPTMVRSHGHWQVLCPQGGERYNVVEMVLADERGRKTQFKFK